MVAALKAHAAWLVNALSVHRNPLRRPIDRIVAVITLLLLTAALIAAPASGLFGVSFYGDLSRRAAETAAATHSAPAVVVTKPDINTVVSESYSQDSLSATAVVEWRHALQPHRATMQVPSDVSIGDTITVWLDDAGNRLPPPPGEGAVLASAVFTAILTLLLSQLVCFALIALTQRGARAIGMRAWEREWTYLHHGGSWSQR